ncbi:MAG TPA: BPL-N domain-containing protein [Parachlamydiaceae bacterium]|nr:BPL-N domain-containing protein [Parachlamydiaceae bacterium]
MSINTEYIGIFQCQSTCINSIMSLAAIAENSFGRKIVYLQSSEIEGWLEKEKGLLILPGGACSGWDNVLSQDFQEKLANWVMKGNKIFGVCAGAYYCSKETIFSFPEKEEIQKIRKVQIFQGRCAGPLYPILKVVKICWHTGTIGHAVLLWGGVFEPELHEGYKTLATFACKKTKGPAVVLGRYGTGLGILSSVHWEWNGEDIVKCNPFNTTKMKAKLDDSAVFRQNCIEDMKRIFFG